MKSTGKDRYSCKVKMSTADEAQLALDQLSKGEITINQARAKFGLEEHPNSELNRLLTKE